jgi:hypothetical protein
VERNLIDIAKYGEQSGENPRIQRGMRMPPHIDDFSLKDILCVAWMRWIDKRVLRAKQVIRIVTLHRLR